MSGRKVNARGALQITDHGINCCCEECVPVCDNQPEYIDLIISGFRLCPDGCYQTELDWRYYRYKWGDFNGHYKLKRVPRKIYKWCQYELNRTILEYDVTDYEKPECRDERDHFVLACDNITVVVESKLKWRNFPASAHVFPLLSEYRNGERTRSYTVFPWSLGFSTDSCCDSTFDYVYDDWHKHTCLYLCYLRPVICTLDVSAYEVIAHC